MRLVPCKFPSARGVRVISPLGDTVSCSPTAQGAAVRDPSVEHARVPQASSQGLRGLLPGRPDPASCHAFPTHCSLTPKGLSPAMSPALQRLVSRTASKYTDRALRASYTPSPARASHLKTPASGPQTPTSTPAPGSATRTPLSQDPACITDNLLQLPARRKASDFF